MRSLLPFIVLCSLVSITFIKHTHAQSENSADDEDEDKTQDITDEDVDEDETQDITDEDVEEAFQNHKNAFQQRQRLESTLVNTDRVIEPKERKADPSLIRDIKADPEIKKKETAQLALEDATNELVGRFSLSQAAIDNDLPNRPLNGENSGQARDECLAAIDVAECDPNSKYRRIDGQCNNLQNPRWGSATYCQPRLLPPNYFGASGFRRSVGGGPLPRPRQLSLNIHFDVDRPTNYVTHMYMFFGQLLDHDIIQTPQSTAVNNEAINCCPVENATHPQCAPILLSENDPFYSQFNMTCMNFVRSAICPTCTLGPRQLMNQLTSFIDASFVYGNSENTTRSLRTNDGTGQLRVQRSDFGDLLPRSPDPENDQCSFPETNDICFQAGDARANQHTVLTSLQTLFVREHNRLARGLRRQNPQWDDERLFQEARRIVGAQMQSITYNEYLPITIGRWSWENEYGLRPLPQSWTRYDPSIDPTTLIEFTTAAFRFGHSMINSIVTENPLNASNDLRLLRNEFFQPFELYDGLAGPLMAGASNSPAQWFDRHLVPDVLNFLYRVRGTPTGLDLAAININRGRDHGLPTYVDTVRFCSNGGVNIRNFNDLVVLGIMERRQARVLQNNYRFVQDVDLWPGILSEIYNPGAVVGPTASCIIGRQFQRLKYGDRFYFEHRYEKGSFTFRQREELRRVTLSSIICLNTEVTSMPVNAMVFAKEPNDIIDCSTVRGINLSYWRA